MTRSIALALAATVLFFVSAAQAQVHLIVLFDTSNNTFELYAEVEDGNAGLAGVVVNWNVSVVTGVENVAPYGLRQSDFTLVGFHIERTSFPSLFAGQGTDVNRILFNVGQAPGSFAHVDAAPHAQPSWDAPVLLATGTYAGDVHLLPQEEWTGAFFARDRIQAANVWNEVGSNIARAATVTTIAVPEPAALSLLVLGGLGLMARRRAA